MNLYILSQLEVNVHELKNFFLNFLNIHKTAALSDKH